MAAQHLSQDEFFEKLSALFSHRKGHDHGAIYLTQKRLTHETSSSLPATTPHDPFPDTHPENPLPILIRATNGKSKRDRPGKIKLSTIVGPEDLEPFYLRYADVCKAGMAALKPRDRSKKKAKAKKKKTNTAAAAAKP